MEPGTPVLASDTSIHLIMSQVYDTVHYSDLSRLAHVFTVPLIRIRLSISLSTNHCVAHHCIQL